MNREIMINLNGADLYDLDVLRMGIKQYIKEYAELNGKNIECDISSY